MSEIVRQFIPPRYKLMMIEKCIVLCINILEKTTQQIDNYAALTVGVIQFTISQIIATNLFTFQIGN